MSDDNVIHLDDLKPHFTVLAMCLSCEERWIGTVIARTSLFKLECPRCGDFNSFASFPPRSYLEEVAK